MIFCRVAIGDHKWNLVISQWTLDNEAICGVAPLRLTPHQKIPSSKILWKICRLVFWNQDDVFFIDYLPKSQLHISYYYLSLLVQLKDILKEKCCGNFINVGSFLHENTTTHRARVTQKKLGYRATNVLITHHIPRIWTRRTATCYRVWKNWMFAFFVWRWCHWFLGVLVERKISWIFWVAFMR